MRRGELIFLSIAIVLLCGLTISGLLEGYPREAMVFPVMVTVLLIAFAAMRALEVRRAPASPGMRDAEDNGEEKPGVFQMLTPFLWVAGVIIVLPVFGYQIGLPLYVLVFLLTHRVSPAMSLAISVGTTLFIYLVFSRLLQVFLPAGIVGGWLG